MSKQSSYFLFLLIFVCAILFSFLSSIEFLLNFANDDSFFYIKTAYNFSKGLGSTFDTVEMTNGYHPLWFIILSAYFFVLNFVTVFTPELYFRFTVFLILVINALTLYVIYCFFKATSGKYAKYFFLFLPLFLTFVAIRDFGMETHLLCLIVALYMLTKSSELKSGISKTGMKSFLLAMIFLTRIDFLFTVIPVIVIADYFTTPSMYRKKLILSSIVSIVIVTSIYFSVNYHFFGELMPVTAKIKNTFPETQLLHNIGKLLEPGANTNQLAKTVFTLIIIITFLLATTRKSIRQKLTGIDYFSFGICCAAMCFLMINILFNIHALKEWYVAFPAFVSSVLLVRMIFLIPRIYLFSLIVFVILFCFMFYITRIINPKWNSAYYYSKEVEKMTAPGDRIFMIDLSGIVGFFSERNIVNGDGLINGFEYQEYLNSKQLGNYFKDKKINYYSTYSQDYAPVVMKDSSGFFIDKKYSNDFGNYPFIFPEKDLVLKYPYYYSYIVGNGTGYWYLFKLED